MNMEPLPETTSGWVRGKGMVHIAHEEGMAVMSHTNGDYGVQAALLPEWIVWSMETI